MITLQELRKVSGLSQQEVCYATHVSPTRLSLFENNQGELSAAEQEQVRKRIISLSVERTKHVRESSRIVQLTESSRSNSRANSKNLTRARHTDSSNARRAVRKFGPVFFRSVSGGETGRGLSWNPTPGTRICLRRTDHKRRRQRRWDAGTNLRVSALTSRIRFGSIPLCCSSRGRSLVNCGQSSTNCL
jgi:transcriptional regulator with XRE-family HTH domain